MTRNEATLLINKAIMDYGIHDAKVKKHGDKSIRGKDYALWIGGRGYDNFSEAVDAIINYRKNKKEEEDLGYMGSAPDKYDPRRDPERGNLGDNPPKDDLAKALHTINHTFNAVGKHVSIQGHTIDGVAEYYVYVTDTFTEDIIRNWGPINKDAASYILIGMLETIKIVRYE